MTDYLALALMFQSVALVGVLWSRHRLAKRHRDCKNTLTRVANERDLIRWDYYMGEPYDEAKHGSTHG